jgi:uncharacterized protein
VDSSGHLMTFTGVDFNILSPTREDIRIKDIAHQLSNICRYNGACRTFYSVAEHCVRLSYLVPKEHALWALLHDAPEAYTGDWITMLKQIPQLEYLRIIERNLMHRICWRFNLPPSEPVAVSVADLRLYVTEASFIHPKCLESYRIKGVEPWPNYIIDTPCFHPLLAEKHFLSRFSELEIKE